MAHFNLHCMEDASSKSHIFIRCRLVLSAIIMPWLLDFCSAHPVSCGLILVPLFFPSRYCRLNFFTPLIGRHINRIFKKWMVTPLVGMVVTNIVNVSPGWSMFWKFLKIVKIIQGPISRLGMNLRWTCGCQSKNVTIHSIHHAFRNSYKL